MTPFVSYPRKTAPPPPIPSLDAASAPLFLGRDALLLVAQFRRLAALEPDAHCPFVSRCAADPSRVASRPPARKSPAPFFPATAPRHRRACGQEKVRCVEMPPAPSLV